MSDENYEIEEIEGFLYWKMKEEFRLAKFFGFGVSSLTNENLHVISNHVGEIIGDYKSLLEDDITLDEFYKENEDLSQSLPQSAFDLDHVRKEIKAGREVADRVGLESSLIYYFPDTTEMIINKLYSENEYEERLKDQLLQEVDIVKELAQEKINEFPPGTESRKDYEDILNQLNGLSTKRIVKKYVFERKREIFE